MQVLVENPIFIQLSVFLVVVASLMTCWSLSTQNTLQIETRVRSLGTRAHGGTERGQETMRTLKARIPRIPQVAESMLVSSGKERERLQHRLLESGIYQPWAMPLYVTTRFALAIGLPGAMIAAAHSIELSLTYALLISGTAAIVGICLPHLWLEHRRANRHMILRRALPDFLDLIVACLGGGLSFQASLRQVTEELRIAHPCLSAELGMVLREIELGGTLDHALQQLAVRTGLDELRTMRSFVHQTTKFGTTITDALGQLAEMLRVQREQRAEELAQKAAVKILFPTILFIFPTIFVVMAGPAAMQIKKGFASSANHQSPSKP